MNVFFSVVVPVYNSKNYLDECVSSVIKQSFSSWELILIDDGSNDGSELLCDCYANEYKNIHVYHKENGGQFSARKLGIEKSIGKYLIFLDSDDFLESNALKVLTSFICEKETDLILYDSYHFVNNEKIIAKDTIDFSDLFNSKEDIIKQCFLKRTSRISMCAYCFKRELFDDFDFVTILPSTVRSQEDFLMVYEIVKKSQSLRVIDKILYNYRNNPNSITHNLSTSVFYDGMLVSSTIYSDILNNFNFSICSDFDLYIKNRLSWLPFSYLLRFAKENKSQDLRKAFKSIKTNFLYKNFTRHCTFEAKSYRLFMLFLRIGFYRLAKKCADLIIGGENEH